MNILDPQGPIGAAERTILIDSVGIMLAIVLPTIAAIFAFAFWFREGNPKARYQPTWAYSGRIELVVWAIPALTVILLGGVAWIGAHQRRGWSVCRTRIRLFDQERQGGMESRRPRGRSARDWNRSGGRCQWRWNPRRHRECAGRR